MKFNFLKFNKKNSPSPESLKPIIFKADLFWFLSLSIFLIISIVTIFIGAKFFYSQYFESYKESTIGDSKDLINVNRLKNTIENRNEFINKEISLPRDPSL